MKCSVALLRIKRSVKKVFKGVAIRLQIDRGSKYIKKCMTEYESGAPKVFKKISVETINRCNGTCPFCPANRNIDKRILEKMSEELFVNICDQLRDMDYEGKVALYCNNEAFLDDRILKFAHIMREKVKKARILIFTNGSLLTIEKVESIIKDIDQLFIDNYNDNLELNPAVKLLADYMERNKDNKELKKIHIDMRFQTEVLSTRGGYSPNKKAKDTFVKVGCTYPFQELAIRPDGKCQLCCADINGDVIVGDATQETLMEIWNGEKLANCRKSLLKGRDDISICKKCDNVPYGYV